eukprot:TRINITY_DN269_c0_g1_i1.p1 TRINITY_DN269_c0_g1~~TRINITY_DN269_c0_g1_i1.p1  ORF type:complete len:162 (+),score=58.56 TRINITY_DN269_c0_g1_i1:59-544(+)
MSLGFKFGQVFVDNSQIFYQTNLMFACVNLKPIVPGHVLVVPKREVLRFKDLNNEEVADLWLSAQLIGSKIEELYECSSVTYACQDGPEAGQTIKQVHVHVIPRKKGDFKFNDEVYEQLEDGEKEEERKPRTSKEMSDEATWLSTFFNNEVVDEDNDNNNN